MIGPLLNCLRARSLNDFKIVSLIMQWSVSVLAERFLGAFAKLRKATVSFLMSVRPHGTTLLPLDRCSWNFKFENILKIFWEKLKSHSIPTIITGTLHEDRYTFLIISRSFLFGMKSVSDKSCTENLNTHFVSNNFFFFENRAVYEIMWENIVQPDIPQMTIFISVINRLALELDI